MSDDDIYHFGVKGMKWGQIRRQYQPTGIPPGPVPGAQTPPQQTAASGNFVQRANQQIASNQQTVGRYKSGMTKQGQAAAVQKARAQQIAKAKAQALVQKEAKAKLRAIKKMDAAKKRAAAAKVRALAKNKRLAKKKHATVKKKAVPKRKTTVKKKVVKKPVAKKVV